MPTHLGQYFPQTEADVVGSLGLTPSNLWLFQESASPVVDVIAAQNFADYNTGLYRQPTAFPRYGIGAAYGVSEGLIINPTPFDDDGVTSFAWLGLIRVGTSHPTAQRSWCYQYSNAASPAVSCRTSVLAVSGYAAAVGVNGNGTKVCTIQVNHDGAYHPWLWVMDRAAATMRVRTDLGSAQVSIAGAGAFGGAGVNRYLFICAATDGADVDCCWLARMSGANAEGLDDAQIIHDFWVGP